MLYEFKHFGLSEYTTKEYGENLNFPAHLHQSFEFITVTSGKMEVTVDGTCYIINKGEALLIFPNQTHSIASTSSTHMLNIFSSELVKAYSSNLSGKIPQENLFVPSKYIVNALDNMRDNASTVQKKGLFYMLCAEFDKNAKYIERKNDDKNLLYKIFEYVEHNYSKECSLRTLVADTGFSYSYLSRYFKKIVGISYNDYVNQYRISKACYSLSNSNCTVLSCAMECGYNSLRSFNRNFMELTGVTPKQFRQQNM